jgi:hypothetical protein
MAPVGVDFGGQLPVQAGRMDTQSRERFVEYGEGFVVQRRDDAAVDVLHLREQFRIELPSGIGEIHPSTAPVTRLGHPGQQLLGRQAADGA